MASTSSSISTARRTSSGSTRARRSSSRRARARGHRARDLASRAPASLLAVEAFAQPAPADPPRRARRSGKVTAAPQPVATATRGPTPRLHPDPPRQRHRRRRARRAGRARRHPDAARGGRRLRLAALRDPGLRRRDVEPDARRFSVREDMRFEPVLARTARCGSRCLPRRVRWSTPSRGDRHLPRACAGFRVYAARRLPRRGRGRVVPRGWRGRLPRRPSAPAPAARAIPSCRRRASSGAMRRPGRRPRRRVRRRAHAVLRAHAASRAERRGIRDRGRAALVSLRACLMTSP